MEETQKSETNIGIAGLTKTGKICVFQWLTTKLDFGLEFPLKTTTQALETRLLFELEGKNETFFAGADATLDSYAHWVKSNHFV